MVKIKIEVTVPKYILKLYVWGSSREGLEGLMNGLLSAYLFRTYQNGSEAHVRIVEWPDLS